MADFETDSRLAQSTLQRSREIDQAKSHPTYSQSSSGSLTFLPQTRYWALFSSFPFSTAQFLLPHLRPRAERDGAHPHPGGSPPWGTGSCGLFTSWPSPLALRGAATFRRETELHPPTGAGQRLRADDPTPQASEDNLSPFFPSPNKGALPSACCACGG